MPSSGRIVCLLVDICYVNEIFCDSVVEVPGDHKSRPPFASTRCTR
jgi:hypothetical protein